MPNEALKNEFKDIYNNKSYFAKDVMKIKTICTKFYLKYLAFFKKNKK
jgi:hypothetical protein